MRTVADDLVTWLRARIDDDERLIERNSGKKGLTDDGNFPDYRTNDDEDLDAADDYLMRFNPGRMRAEIDAKRRVLDAHTTAASAEDSEYDGGVTAGLLTALRLLALPYADRPGYRFEWAPA